MESSGVVAKPMTFGMFALGSSAFLCCRPDPNSQPKDVNKSVHNGEPVAKKMKNDMETGFIQVLLKDFWLLEHPKRGICDYHMVVGYCMVLSEPEDRPAHVQAVWQSSMQRRLWQKPFLGQMRVLPKLGSVVRGTNNTSYNLNSLQRII